MTNKLIATVALPWVFVYAAVAFILWQADPSEWGEHTRFVFVYLSVGFSLLSVCINKAAKA